MSVIHRLPSGLSISSELVLLLKPTFSTHTIVAVDDVHLTIMDRKRTTLTVMQSGNSTRDCRSYASSSSSRTGGDRAIHCIKHETSVELTFMNVMNVEKSKLKQQS